jgi:hypothetical protein
LSQLALSYYGDSAGTGYYETAVELLSSGFDFENDDPANTDNLYMEFWDNSPTIAIDPGTYYVDEDNFSAGRVSYIEVLTGWTYDPVTDEETADYFAGINNSSADDSIVSGTVVVVTSGQTYTFTMDLTLADGGKIIGTYTGTPDYQIDKSDLVYR